MTTSFLEIVELPNGEFALRRIDDDSAPLVKIRFSEEAQAMLQDRDMAVAKAMINAAIETVGDMSSDWEEFESEEDELTAEAAYHTLH